jgi:hypothetical protein
MHYLRARVTRRWALGCLVAAVAAMTAQAGAEARHGRHRDPAIDDLLELEVQQNHLRQLSETSASVLDAANQSSSSMARNVKS